MYPVAPTTAIFSPVHDSPGTAWSRDCRRVVKVRGANADAVETNANAVQSKKDVRLVIMFAATVIDFVYVDELLFFYSPQRDLRRDKPNVNVGLWMTM